LVILDQHALAERIIYEKLIKKDLDTQSQQLLIQENLNLTGKEISVLAEYRQIFLDM
jgi:DNA mismatch repair ATPase MutL